VTGAEADLQHARAAYGQRDWVAARAAFERAKDVAPLAPDDLYALSTCHWWLGDLPAVLDLQQDAFQGYLDDGEAAGAAMVAIDLGYTLSLRGDDARASGWISRARRLLDELGERPEHGYLAYLRFESALIRGDLSAAAEAARRVRDLGARHTDETLTALGVLGEGRVLVRRGELESGLPLLDDAMVAAVSDVLDPAWAGNIYCHLMSACHEIADVRRAAEWTDATSRWCESMPGAGPFLGICRVHRAQTLQVRGAWDAAEREARRVCDELADLDVMIVAEARTLLGDLCRQRGDLDGAEAAYLASHRLGGDPQPGLALLRLARGDVAGARASLRAALLARGDDPLGRARLLPAAVEVALAAGDADSARTHSEDLDAAAEAFATTGFTVLASLTRGTLYLATDEVERAVTVLRTALHAAQELEAPYDVARARSLLAEAYERLGDRELAALERNAAGGGYAALGAEPHPSWSPRRERRDDGLTPREVEVLGLVATGCSNQEIAEQLVLSVRTVERHLAGIYLKLDLHGRSARAAAVSYALQHGVLPRF
jgi:ATP/maltotriose-dependent transcriptional regulator MalT